MTASQHAISESAMNYHSRFQILESDEERFLLFAISSGLQGKVLSESELPDFFEAIDWEKLLQLSFENRAASFLAYVLSDLVKNGKIPHPQSSILRKFFIETTQNNLRIKYTLQKILAAFEEKSIDVIVLKGAVLAYTVWPNMGARQMHDIDIVVQGDRIEEAIELFDEMGYLYTGYKTYEWHLEHTKEFAPFVRPGTDLEIELHYRFFTPNPKFNIDESQFWNNSVAVDFEGVPARILGPEEQLMHLCFHVSIGHFLGDNMRSLMDIVLVAERYKGKFDSKKLDSLLRHSHLGPLLAFPIYVSTRFLGANFEGAIENPAGALSLHYSGYKLKILEKAGERFLFKTEPESLFDWGFRRIAKLVMYDNKVGMIGILLCFVFAQEEVTLFEEPKPLLGRIRATIARRALLTGRLTRNLLLKLKSG